MNIDEFTNVRTAEVHIKSPILYITQYEWCISQNQSTSEHIVGRLPSSDDPIWRCRPTERFVRSRLDRSCASTLVRRPGLSTPGSASRSRHFGSSIPSSISRLASTRSRSKTFSLTAESRPPFIPFHSLYQVHCARTDWPTNPFIIRKQRIILFTYFLRFFFMG